MLKAALTRLGLMKRKPQRTAREVLMAVADDFSNRKLVPSTRNSACSSCGNCKRGCGIKESL